MFNVQIRITGDKETIARLNKTGQGLKNWQSTLVKVGDLLQRVYGVRNFETVGAYIGQRWAELKPSTIRSKVKRWPGRDILVASGTMKGAWEHQAFPTRLTLKNTAEYAHWHQTGTGRMASRPIIDVNKRVKDDIIEVFKTDLAQKLQEAFR